MYNPDNLPLWKSHKIVAAAKIAKITLPEGHYRLAPLALELADGTTRDLLVTIEFIQRFKPEVGGYFVRYDSGNAIFFNGDEFETTYTLVPAAPLTDCDVSLSEFMKRPKVWEVVGDEPGCAAPVVLMLMAEMREAAARLAEGDTALLRRQGHTAAADAYSMAARRIRAIDAETLMSEVLGMPRTTPTEFEAFKQAASAAQFDSQQDARDAVLAEFLAVDELRIWLNEHEYADHTWWWKKKKADFDRREPAVWGSVRAALMTAAPSAEVAIGGPVQDERAAFEAWAKDQGSTNFYRTVGNPKLYDDLKLRSQYKAWCAALAAKAAPGQQVDGGVA